MGLITTQANISVLPFYSNQYSVYDFILAALRALSCADSFLVCRLEPSKDSPFRTPPDQIQRCRKC